MMITLVVAGLVGLVAAKTPSASTPLQRNETTPVPAEATLVPPAEFFAQAPGTLACYRWRAGAGHTIEDAEMEIAIENVDGEFRATDAFDSIYGAWELPATEGTDRAACFLATTSTEASVDVRLRAHRINDISDAEVLGEMEEAIVLEIQRSANETYWVFEMGVDALELLDAVDAAIASGGFWEDSPYGLWHESGEYTLKFSWNVTASDAEYEFANVEVYFSQLVFDAFRSGAGALIPGWVAIFLSAVFLASLL